MRLPWKRSPLSVHEHAKAVSRSSTEWTAEIERLKHELTEIDVQRATTIAEAGRATLDGQVARALDLQRSVDGLNGREQVINAAISTAEGRQADALQDEERRRQSSQLRQYHALLATWLAGTAAVKEAEAALTAAVRARNGAVDGGTINSLYHGLTVAGVVVEAREDILMRVQTPESLRALAERHQKLAQTATLDDAGVTITSDETIDRDSLPLTAKERTVAEIQAANASAAGQVTHAMLEAVDAELKAVRETAKRAAEEQNADRYQWAAKAEQLTIKRADMAAELKAQGVPA